MAAAGGLMAGLVTAVWLLWWQLVTTYDAHAHAYAHTIIRRRILDVLRSPSTMVNMSTVSGINVGSSSCSSVMSSYSDNYSNDGSNSSSSKSMGVSGDCRISNSSSSSSI